MLNNSSKFNSRKFLITLITIVIVSLISLYSIYKLYTVSDITEIITTGIMWVSVVACTYMGSNAAMNFSNVKNMKDVIPKKDDIDYNNP